MNITLQTLSKQMIQFMNNELSAEECNEFKRTLGVEKLTGPDQEGFLADAERNILYQGLKNIALWKSTN